MARQHIHDRRAGHGNSGSSWISYSDIMAALVLVFVLFLTYNLYQYNLMMETKTAELEAATLQVQTQQAQLEEQQSILVIALSDLEQANSELEKVRIDLAEQEARLAAQTIILIGQQAELSETKATLSAREAELTALQLQLIAKQEELENATLLLQAQQDALDAQALRLDALVGVRTQIIKALSEALSSSSLNATVDPNTGDIVLESTVFFNTGSSEIKSEGKAMLDTFLPIYLDVLLRPEYSEYLGEIIIEGHTDSDGSYINNLKLSQNRALGVVEYCLNMPSLTNGQRSLLQKILTAKGRSSSDLVYNADGTENKNASRRVEFKFSLKDAEMIDQINQILQGGS